MSAFGSYNERNRPVFKDSCVIAIANSMFSFISGFAVFAALGHLAYLSNTTVKELDFAGFSLVFGTWPVVFGTLPGGEHWVPLLFFDLFLLGMTLDLVSLRVPSRLPLTPSTLASGRSGSLPSFSAQLGLDSLSCAAPMPVSTS